MRPKQNSKTKPKIKIDMRPQPQYDSNVVSTVKKVIPSQNHFHEDFKSNHLTDQVPSNILSSKNIFQ